MSDDLAAFILARLDEDEASAKAVYVARSADPAFREEAGRWTLRDHPSESAMISDGNGATVVFDEGTPSDEEAAHIARHDPARVLREVEAKRAILAWYSGLDIDYDYGTFPDDTVAALAAVYSDHAQYRAEWKP